MTDRYREIEEVWDQLAQTFRNWRGVRPRRSWGKTGLSERAAYQRLRMLEGGREAKRYFELTKELTVAELDYLHCRAVINFEQAQAAARIATILNLTVFVAGLVLFNQVFPGYIAGMFETLLSTEDYASILFIVATAILFICVIIAVLSYSYGGTSQARDLKHLLELSLAKRALKKKSTAQPMSDFTQDLRESHISEI